MLESFLLVNLYDSLKLNELKIITIKKIPWVLGISTFKILDWSTITTVIGRYTANQNNNKYIYNFINSYLI